MELNGLEITLIGGAIASVSAWISTTIQGRAYQSKSGCDERHKGICMEVEGIKTHVKTGSEAIMRMLCEIVLHLPIEERHKADILNDRGGK